MMRHSQGIDLPSEIGVMAHLADVADQERGADIHGGNGAGAETGPLTCSACRRAFEHDAHKRGRRPSKCPECRGGGVHGHAQRPEARQVTAEEAVDQVRAGQRCAYCGVAFRPGEATVQINGRAYHDDDACAGEARRRLGA
jgi:predicted Zn-ribbon and HTH transcriptional regulator